MDLLLDNPLLRRTLAPWKEDLKDFIEMVKLRDHWPGLKNFFQQGFAGQVSDLITSSKEQP